MQGYVTRRIVLRFGDQDYRIRALSDLQQFADPDQHAERAGISSAQWALFGQVWPAARMLAEAMSRHAIAGKRILEIGCGLGLASLVLQCRGADVVASDYHPLAEVFLAYNCALNELPAVSYRELQWSVPNETLGRFDLIIGSDILYERDHSSLLAALVSRHASELAEVLISDPGRGNSGPLTRALAAQGFDVSEQRGPMGTNDTPPFRGRLLSYRRSARVPGSVADAGQMATGCEGTHRPGPLAG
ncbi:MAG: methyltransferase domain-containing protein [Dokdonella sp.]|uniref:class I SAM-dependent methyltransferase n=1 Tax=Dokdonella sp. TaxID=2291710 RepID=UPI003265FF8F